MELVDGMVYNFLEWLKYEMDGCDYLFCGEYVCFLFCFLICLYVCFCGLCYYGCFLFVYGFGSKMENV